jgi:hypothetical protein
MSLYAVVGTSPMLARWRTFLMSWLTYGNCAKFIGLFDVFDIAENLVAISENNHARGLKLSAEWLVLSCADFRNCEVA